MDHDLEILGKSIEICWNPHIIFQLTSPERSTVEPCPYHPSTGTLWLLGCLLSTLWSFHFLASKRVLNSALYGIECKGCVDGAENKTQPPARPGWLIVLLYPSTRSIYSPWKRLFFWVHMTLKLIQYPTGPHWVQLRWVTDPSPPASVRKKFKVTFHKGTASH